MGTKYSWDSMLNRVNQASLSEAARIHAKKKKTWQKVFPYPHLHFTCVLLIQFTQCHHHNNHGCTILGFNVSVPIGVFNFLGMLHLHAYMLRPKMASMTQFPCVTFMNWVNRKCGYMVRLTGRKHFFMRCKCFFWGVCGRGGFNTKHFPNNI